MGFERHLLFIPLCTAESLQLYLTEEQAARIDSRCPESSQPFTKVSSPLRKGTFWSVLSEIHICTRSTTEKAQFSGWEWFFWSVF